MRSPMDGMSDDEFIQKLKDPFWRITSGALYKIMIKGEGDEEAFVVPFKPNAAQLALLNNLWYRNIILKARQFGFCLDPSTRVLTADLRWVRIDSLRRGDEVVAVDEQPPGGRGKARKMRTAAVEAAVRVHRKAYRITFDDGRAVVCTGQHPWLSRKTGTQAAWRSIEGKGNQVVGRLKIGTRVRWVARPWENHADYEDGWFSGMLDGEGSMALAKSTGAEINVSQVHGPVWDRLIEYAESRGYSYRIENDNQPSRVSKHGNRPVPKLCFSRMDEMFRLIGTTRPSRFIQNRFWEGKELPGKRNGGVGWSTITSIEPLEEQTMIDLQTSTGTYIAEGFVSHNTTLIAIVWLDHALFVDDQRCGIVAHDLESAEAIFRDKVKFAYKNLPPTLRDNMPLERDSAKELVFAHNNSAIRVATSMRSGTIHRLHISEFGKICAKYPDKAKEVMTGSIPSVPLNGITIIESTAEGQEGAYYNMSTRAQQQQQAGKKLTKRDYRFNFFGWWMNPEYVMDPKGVVISDQDNEYFDQVEAEIGRELTQEQCAWYVATRDADYPENPELMWQEYPSTPEEAFKRSTDGCWFTKQMAAMRKEGRIKKLPVVQSEPCMTFWDIGNTDGTAIWVMQHIGHEYRCINFYEAWGEPYADAVNWLQSLGLVWDTMYLPHDAEHRRQGKRENQSPLEMLEELMPGVRFEVVPRIDDITWGIQQTRDAFPLLYIDEEACKEGIVHLDLYRKKWNTIQAVWTDVPNKLDGHSEAADALRQFGQALASGQLNTRGPTTKKRKPRSWRAA